MISETSLTDSISSNIPSPPLKDSTFCDTSFLSVKTCDMSPTGIDQSFPYMTLGSNSWTPITTPPSLCYPPMQVMAYGMMPYWVMPHLQNPLLNQAGPPASSALNSLATGSRAYTEPLYEWIKNHEKDPYPTRREKEQLARTCGMTSRQIEHWFANARRRMKKVNNSKKLRSLLSDEGRQMDKEVMSDDSNVFATSFSSSSSSEDVPVTPNRLLTDLNTSNNVLNSSSGSEEIKKPKGIWSIVSTLE